MKCTLVGVKRVDYKSRKTGNPVLGWNLYVTHAGSDVEGLVAEDFYCKDDMSSAVIAVKPHIGKEIEVYFNRFGSVNLSVL